MKTMGFWAGIALMLSAPAALADRITTMTREERCVYVARLQAAAALQFLEGKRREEVRIHWHGDETDHEMRFVTRVIDEGYAAMAREASAGRRSTPVEAIGDRAYQGCMSEKEL